MKVFVADGAQNLGIEAAKVVAGKINEAIRLRGHARIALSTGASQLETLKALLELEVAWEKVTMFHLDEYIGLPESHAASFRKYLKDRFVSKIPLKEAVFVNGEGNIKETIAELTARICEAPIDVGVIGIGENAHIAFNDPPADFNTKESYIVVDLDDKCKLQQVNEDWFPDSSAVPKQAISMTPHRIMSCRTVVSPVPNLMKADAIQRVLESNRVDEMIPGTLLKTHPDFYLFIDQSSSSKCSQELLASYTNH